MGDQTKFSKNFIIRFLRSKSFLNVFAYCFSMINVKIISYGWWGESVLLPVRVPSLSAPPAKGS